MSTSSHHHHHYQHHRDQPRRVTIADGAAAFLQSYDSVYSTFERGTLFRANGRIYFDVCNQSALHKFIVRRLEELLPVNTVLWSLLEQQQNRTTAPGQHHTDDDDDDDGDDGSEFRKHPTAISDTYTTSQHQRPCWTPDSNWSVYLDLRTFRCSYLACVLNEDLHIHDALPIAIGSQLEQRALDEAVGSFVDSRIAKDYLWQQIVLRFSRATVIALIRSRVFSVTDDLQSVLAGCYVIGGTFVYSASKEINKNMSCHMLLTEENVISFMYERLHGVGHKMFIKYLPALDTVRPTDGFPQNSGDDNYSTTYDTAEYLNDSRRSVRGDESWCKFGKLYWRDSRGIVTTLTPEIFKGIYVSRCLEPEFEQTLAAELDYVRFCDKTYAFMLSTSATPTDIDDFSNKIVLSYADAIASLLDKMFVMSVTVNHTALWKKVGRGMVLDYLSKYISVEPDCRAVQQMDKRVRRQAMMHANRTTTTATNAARASSAAAAAAKRYGGFSGGGGGGGYTTNAGGVVTINNSTLAASASAAAAAESAAAAVTITTNTTTTTTNTIILCDSENSEESTETNFPAVNSDNTDTPSSVGAPAPYPSAKVLSADRYSRTKAPPKPRRSAATIHSGTINTLLGSVKTTSASGNSMLSTIMHSPVLIGYYCASFQRSKQKKSKRRFVNRAIPDDGLGYICNVNAGSMSSGRRLFATSECERSYGYVNGDRLTETLNFYVQIVERACAAAATAAAVVPGDDTNTATSAHFVYFFWNNKPLRFETKIHIRRRHQSSDHDPSVSPLYSWFMQEIWLPLKRPLDAPTRLCEICLVVDVCGNVCSNQDMTSPNTGNALFINVTSIDGVYFRHVPEAIFTQAKPSTQVRDLYAEGQLVVYPTSRREFNQNVQIAASDGYAAFSGDNSRNDFGLRVMCSSVAADNASKCDVGGDVDGEDDDDWLQQLFGSSEPSTPRNTHPSNNTEPNRWVVRRGADFYSLDRIRRINAIRRIRAVQIVNQRQAIWQQELGQRMPVCALVRDLFVGPMSYNDVKRQTAGINCAKTICGSIDHLEAGRLVNLGVQFFVSPRSESNYKRRRRNDDPRDALMATAVRSTLPLLARQLCHLPRVGFGNIDGDNVEDAIIVNRGVDFGIHALFQASFRISIHFVDEKTADRLRSHISVTLPHNGVPGRKFSTAVAEYDGRTKPGTVGSNGTDTSAQLNYVKIMHQGTLRGILVPIAEIFCDCPQSARLVVDQYPRYIIDRHDNTHRYQVYRLFDEKFLLDVVVQIDQQQQAQQHHRKRRHSYTEEQTDISSPYAIYLLRHDDTVFTARNTTASHNTSPVYVPTDIATNSLIDQVRLRLFPFDGSSGGNNNNDNSTSPKKTAWTNSAAAPPPGSSTSRTNVITIEEDQSDTTAANNTAAATTQDNDGAALTGSVLGARSRTYGQVCESHFVQLEFVVRTPMFNAAKLGNQFSQKGEVVVKDLRPYFAPGEQVPDIVYNVSTILSRFTSGQYAMQLRQDRRDVITVNGETMMTGLVPAFNMSTFQKDSITPCRFDFMWQYALLGLKMPLTHQHVKAQDINNKRSAVVSNDMQYMLGLYQTIGADIALRRNNSGTVDEDDDDDIVHPGDGANNKTTAFAGPGINWQFADKFISPADVQQMRTLYSEFSAIVAATNNATKSKS